MRGIMEVVSILTEVTIGSGVVEELEMIGLPYLTPSHQYIGASPQTLMGTRVPRGTPP